LSEHRPDLRRLFASVDGKLSPQQQLELRLHLESCKPCAAELAKIRHMRSALRELGQQMPAPPAANPIAEARLIQALGTRGAPGLRIQWWWLPATAAATLLLALLVLPSLRGGTPTSPVMANVQTAPAGASGAVATVLALRGQVQEGPSADKLHAGRAGEELPASTILRTGPDSEARLSLAAGGEVVLVASGALVLPAEAKGLLRLEAGAIDVQVVPRAEGERPFGIETALARIEAIGTKFRVVHEAGFTSVDVQEGKVRFVSLRSDEEQLIVAGKAAKVDGTGRVAEIPAGGVQVAVAPPPVEPEPVEPAFEEPAPTEEPVAQEPMRVQRARGTIDQGRVRARVSRQRGALIACYNDYVMRQSPQAVEARVSFVVLENGAVGPVDINLSVDDTQLKECIDRVFRAIEFPHPQGGPARVFYPVSFSL
jgi:anti-sigma factor RsiW